jgi:hypothetical protein
MTITLWFIITLVASGLAVWDAIIRLRGHRSSSILAILELIFGGLLLLSLFITIPGAGWIIPLGLLIVLLILIFVRVKGPNARLITIIAAVLTAVIVLQTAGWLNIPGL